MNRNVALALAILLLSTPSAFAAATPQATDHVRRAADSVPLDVPVLIVGECPLDEPTTPAVETRLTDPRTRDVVKTSHEEGFCALDQWCVDGCYPAWQDCLQNCNQYPSGSPEKDACIAACDHDYHECYYPECCIN